MPHKDNTSEQYRQYRIRYNGRRRASRKTDEERKKAAAYAKEWRDKNIDHVRAYQRDRNAKRAAELAEVRAAWRRSAKGMIHTLFQNARNRARRKGLEFTLSPSDIVIPEKCPVLGTDLVIGEGKVHQASPQLDRIDNNKGYTPDNVIVVSKRANTIKNDATIDELRKVADFYGGL